MEKKDPPCPFDARIAYEEALCSGCYNCIEVCFMQVFGKNKLTGKVKFINSDDCTACGDCVGVCLESALFLTRNHPHHHH